MRTNIPLVSIVCPAFQEEEVLPLFQRDLSLVLSQMERQYQFEIIYVDDGSSDLTATILGKIAKMDKRVSYISFTRNQGHQAALLAGMKHARGEAVISLDSDLQHPPALIEELLCQWRNGYQVVQTLRTANNSAGWFKAKSSRWFYKLLEFACQTKVPEGAADFRLLDRVGVDAILLHREKGLFLRGLIPSLGLETAYVRYEAAPRAAGQTKYSLKKMVNLAADAFFQGGYGPARLAWPIAGMGFALVLVLLFAGIWRAIAGAPGLELAIWGLGFAIVASSTGVIVLLGILGEYVARILEQSRNRPAYIVKKHQIPKGKSKKPGFDTVEGTKQSVGF